MEENHIQRIYWNDVLSQTVYVYGSSILFDEKSVHFENFPFASGKVIKKWRSRTNYQAERTSPELPLLSPGVTYRLVTNWVVEPENTLTIHIEYRNRQNDVVRVDVLRDKEQLFTFPEDAFTYTISLTGAGCDRLTFKYMDLYGIDLPKEITLEPVKVRSYRPHASPKVLSLFLNVKE